MTEHQIHILTGILLAAVFLLGMIALFAPASRRRAAKANPDKSGKMELLNFDEARRRKKNRIKYRKEGKRKR